MRSTLSLIRREFTAYFGSPVAYVVFATFLLGTGLLFGFTLQQLTARGPQGTEFPLQGLLGNVGFWLIFWVIPPLLTMRLFAEERSTGTLEMLMTAPLRDGQVVGAKFVAAYLFYLLLLVPTLAYLPVLLDLKDWRFAWVVTPGSIGLMVGGGLVVIGLLISLVRCGVAAVLTLLLGAVVVGVGVWLHYWLEEGTKLVTVTAGIDPMPALSSYLCLALAGAMFLAIGLWVSSLVRSQMVAALVALAISSVFLLGGFLTLGGLLPAPSDSGVWSHRLLTYVSVPLHFSRDFARGLVDSRHLVLYVSVTLTCLFLTVRSLESRRWS